VRKTGGTSKPLLASLGYSSLFKNRFTPVKEDLKEAPVGRSMDHEILPKQGLEVDAEINYSCISIYICDYGRNSSRDINSFNVKYSNDYSNQKSAYNTIHNNSDYDNHHMLSLWQ
jgi:hypothetical protein